jgi:hypothetical protein
MLNFKLVGMDVADGLEDIGALVVIIMSVRAEDDSDGSIGADATGADDRAGTRGANDTGAAVGTNDIGTEDTIMTGDRLIFSVEGNDLWEPGLVVLEGSRNTVGTKDGTSPAGSGDEAAIVGTNTNIVVGTVSIVDCVGLTESGGVNDGIIEEIDPLSCLAKTTGTSIEERNSKSKALRKAFQHVVCAFILKATKFLYLNP